MDILLIIIGIILIVTAFIGCVLPALPGPPLGYLALILLQFGSTSPFSTNYLLILGAVIAGIFALDYLLPVFGAKVFGVSKYGTWGSFIGMIIGLIFFPPFGLIIGVILGAVIGELAAGKEKSDALKAGAATFALTILMMIIKLSLVGYMAYVFAVEGFLLVT
jgi:uncharacterized protein YqgC (DUF456 family)